MVTIATILSWFENSGNRIWIGDEVDRNTPIVGPKGVEESDVNHISFLSKKYQDRAEELISNSRCPILLIDQDLEDHILVKNKFSRKAFVICNDPKREIYQLASKFFMGEKIPSETQIHPNALVEDSVLLGQKVKIGAFAVIEENVKIGSRCIIGSNTVIKSNTTIGNDVVIGACNVIGGEGFGYIKNNSNSEYDHFPHLGNVIIHDRVHIGNNTCIDRGSLNDTIIFEGVKIDNLVHIAHNVQIGKNSLVIACSMIAGSVKIGENSWIAPCSTIRNAITVGKNVTVGLSSTVTKSVEDDQTVLGNPAMSIEDFKSLRKHQKSIISNSLEDQK